MPSLMHGRDPNQPQHFKPMKLFTALAALTLIAAPVQAFELQMATDCACVVKNMELTMLEINSVSGVRQPLTQGQKASLQEIAATCTPEMF